MGCSLVSWCGVGGPGHNTQAHTPDTHTLVLIRTHAHTQGRARCVYPTPNSRPRCAHSHSPMCVVSRCITWAYARACTAVTHNVAVQIRDVLEAGDNALLAALCEVRHMQETDG
jgi:hypothetical protein